MTPTPRTDACTFHLALCNNDLPTDAVVPAEKMKELERENVELRKALGDLVTTSTEASEVLGDYRIDGECNNEDVIKVHGKLDSEITAARSVLEPAQPPAQKQ